MKNTMANGPVGKNVKHQSAKTSAEFRDLANARTTPEQPAATGQPLTHYHSMFYRLLSWKNPRASAIAFATTVLVIFAARYLPVLRYFFKLTYITLGATATAEIAGKAVLGNGLTSQMRPRKYWLIPRESLSRFLDDVEQLINFFVIEFQRILFAENVYATVAAFIAAFASYFLIMFVPLWGLSLISTCIMYLAPLIYIKNKDIIDAQLKATGNMVNEQTAQLREIAAQHTGKATETMRTYAGEYSQKAQDMIAQARSKATGTGVKEGDLPNAPSTEPKASSPKSKKTAEPLAS
jgi:ABC-type multidrug transport system fused ATPase/permease subunit